MVTSTLVSPAFDVGLQLPNLGRPRVIHAHSCSTNFTFGNSLHTAFRHNEKTNTAPRWGRGRVEGTYRRCFFGRPTRQSSLARTSSFEPRTSSAPDTTTTTSAAAAVSGTAAVAARLRRRLTNGGGAAELGRGGEKEGGRTSSSAKRFGGSRMGEVEVCPLRWRTSSMVRWPP